MNTTIISLIYFLIGIMLGCFMFYKAGQQKRLLDNFVLSRTEEAIVKEKEFWYRNIGIAALSLWPIVLIIGMIFFLYKKCYDRGKKL